MVRRRARHENDGELVAGVSDELREPGHLALGKGELRRETHFLVGKLLHFGLHDRFILEPVKLFPLHTR